MQSWHKFLSSALQSQGFVIISCHKLSMIIFLFKFTFIYLYVYTDIYIHTYMNCTCYSMHMQVRWLLGGINFLLLPMLVPQIGPYTEYLHRLHASSLLCWSLLPFHLQEASVKTFFLHSRLLISLLFYFVAII